LLKYFLISFVILPVLLGVLASRGRAGSADRTLLRAAWAVYAVLWFATLYLLRKRWT
jgi:hypothetical protein